MKNLLIIWMLFLTAFLGAQNPVSHVPADVTFLFTWNAGKIGEKVNTRQLMQQESVDLLFRELVRGMDSLQQAGYHDLMTSPETCGIDSRSALHFFGRNDEAGMFFALLMPLSNASLLEDFVNRQAAISGDPAPIRQQEGFRMAGLDSYYLGWNEKVAIIAGGREARQEYDFDIWEDGPVYEEEDYGYEEEGEEEPADWYGEEPVEEIAEEEYVEAPAGATVPEWMLSWLDEVLNRRFAASITGNPYFQNAIAEPADAHFWVDYGVLMQIDNPLSGGGMGYPMNPMASTSELFNQLYKGIYYSIGLNFNQGAVEMDTRMLGDGKMLRVMQDAYDARFNRKMLKYIDNRSLLGYYSLRVDVEALAEGMKDILFAAMAEMPQFGEGMVRMMEVIGIVVDEEALYDLFKGDIFLAVTGVREAEIPVVTYEYDLDFNAAEVEKIIHKQYPEVLLMASYGDEDNMRKLIRLGESFNLFLSMGDHYAIMGADESENFYLAMKNGLLIFTNDATLIGERLDAGVKKAHRLAKAHRKALRRNVQSMHWDIQSTWTAIEQTDVAEEDRELVEMMQDMKNAVESISLHTSRKVKPSIHGRLTFDLMDKESNALEQILSMMNKFVLESFGLERI